MNMQDSIVITYMGRTMKVSKEMALDGHMTLRDVLERGFPSLRAEKDDK